MSDEMFFTSDERSLVRGKRVAARTETCRPCLLAERGPSPHAFEGVIMDMSPHGMLIRTLEPVPIGADVVIQLMRDDGFEKALSVPRDGTIVRHDPANNSFTDLGVQLVNRQIPKASERPIFIEQRKPRPKSAPTRMHTLDVTIGGPRAARRGR